MSLSTAEVTVRIAGTGDSVPSRAVHSGEPAGWTEEHTGSACRDFPAFGLEGTGIPAFDLDRAESML